MSSSEEDEFDVVEGSEESSEEDEYDAPLEEASGSEEESEEEEEEEEGGEEEWTDDHLKLLYMISRYAKQAASPDDEETWIRKNSLLVLMYQGIVDQVLDYDYAPISMLVGQKRCWLNITQEGKDDIDDLRAGGLLNALKLSSEDLQPVTAYQVSAAGLEMVPMIPEEMIEAVDEFIEHEGELIEVMFDLREGQKDDEGEDAGPCFWLKTPDGGYQEESGITDTEDVSYVASPYLPECLRGFGPKCNDNSKRAHEAAEGESQLKDELDAQIVLKNLQVLVGEWIPFGANQIVAVNEKLGTADRCQGGLFTGELDSDPTATSFEVPAGLTKVGVLDFNEVKYINIEAEINFPEDEGIVKVEEFGMHFDVNGKVVYGMKIDAIMDKLQDDICIDLLARVLVDVHLDSSRITKDLISKYQMTLLECAFMNDAANRDKFNMLITESIEPKMEAIEYLDGEDIENELKQVLGDTQGAYDLTANDVLITGRNGLLIAGPNAKQHEPALVLYLQLHSRNMFMRVFFTRVFVLGDELRKIRDMIGLAQFAHSNESGGIKVGDPTIVDKVRDRLSVASRDLILMLETMGFMADSLEAGVLQALPRPKDQGGKELHRVLRNDFMIANLKKRVRDLQKNLNGCVKELSNLSAMTEVINTKQLEDVYRGVEKNTKTLVDAAAANERAAASLEIMQVVFFASESFGYIDHFFGMVGFGTSDFQQWVLDNLVRCRAVPCLACYSVKSSVVSCRVVSPPAVLSQLSDTLGSAYGIGDGVSSSDSGAACCCCVLPPCFVQVAPPGRWFAFNMSICFVLCYLLKQLMAHLAEGSLNFLLFEVVFNTKIDPKKFKEYLDEKDLAISDGQLGDGSLLKSAIWDEDDESVWCVLQRPPA